MDIEIDEKHNKVRVWISHTLIGFATIRLVDEFPAEAEAPLVSEFYRLPEPAAPGCFLTKTGERLRANYRCYNAAIALNRRAGREVARLARGDYPTVFVLQHAL